MKRYLHLVLLGGAWAVLSACVADMPRLQFAGLWENMTPQTQDSFLKRLAQEYRSMAFIEGEILQDKEDEAHFLQKARRADSGKTVEPDSPSIVTLTPTMVQMLDRSRSELLDLMPRAGIGKNDLYLARAQARFDCWLQEASEHPEEKSTSCRSAFYTALEAVDRHTPMPVPSMTPRQKKKMEQADKSDKKKIAKKSDKKASNANAAHGLYTLYFDYNSAALNDKAMAVIKDMADAYFDGGNDIKVDLTGYSDGADNETNRKLAQRRMIAVKNAMILYGANPSLIETDHSYVLSGKEASEAVMMNPQDRRVEIELERLPRG